MNTRFPHFRPSFYPLLIGSLFGIGMLGGTGCGGDDTLAANQAMQAILRTQQGVAAINKARMLAAPFKHLNTEFTLSTLDAMVQDVYGDCVVIENHDDVHRAVISHTCPSAPLSCTGFFDYGKREEKTTSGSIHWLTLATHQLVCNAQPLEATLQLRAYRATQDMPYDQEMRIQNLSYSEDLRGDDDPAPLTVNDFQGQFFFRDDMVYPLDGGELPVTILDGQASFHDPELNRDWAIETQTIGVVAYNSIPRTGMLKLQSVPDDTWHFNTNWWAQSNTSTRVRVTHGKDVWIGCISHGDDDACTQKEPTTPIE